MTDYKDPRTHGKPLLQSRKAQRIALMIILVIGLLSIYSLAIKDDRLQTLPTKAEKIHKAQIERDERAALALFCIGPK